MTKHSDEKKITDKRPPLEKLNSGLIAQYFHRQIDESAYSVLDRITFGHKVLQDRHSYATEVQRVLTELKITANLIKQIEANDTIEIDGKIISGEELINYYVGIFFGLVHQAKDKILRLIDMMAASDDQKAPYKGSKSMNPSAVLKKHDAIIDDIGVRDLVNAWGQESGSSIAIILKKRTQHEHFTSNIQLDSDFQNIRSARTLLNPAAAATLNDEGLAYMHKLADESFEKYKSSIVESRLMLRE